MVVFDFKKFENSFHVGLFDTAPGEKRSAILSPISYLTVVQQESPSNLSKFRPSVPYWGQKPVSWKPRMSSGGKRNYTEVLFFFKEIRRQVFLLVFYELIFFHASHVTAILDPIYNHWQVWIGAVTVFTPDQWWVIEVSWPVYPDITMDIRSSVSAGN